MGPRPPDVGPAGFAPRLLTQVYRLMFGPTAPLMPRGGRASW